MASNLEISVNNYKARAADDLVLTERQPYSFWQKKCIRKIIDGYEILIFLDKLGSTGICIRPEGSVFQKDYILVGELFQYCRSSIKTKEVFNDLCLNEGWKIAPIEIFSGYGKGRLFWAPRWYPYDDWDFRFKWQTILIEKLNSSIEEFIKLYQTKKYFVGEKKRPMKLAITEINFYI